MDHLKRLINKEIEDPMIREKIGTILFDFVFQHVHDLIFIMKVEVGPRFKYLFVNENGLLHARLSSSCIGKYLEEVLNKEKAKEIHKYYQKAIEEKKTITYRDSFRLLDGTLTYCESVLTPIFDEKGNALYITTITRDITKVIEEKQQLIESEQRYRSLVDHNLDGIISINPNGFIMSCNKSAEEIIGLKEKELIDRLIYHFVPEKDKPLIDEMISISREGKAYESLDIHFFHKNGNLITTHLKSVPIIVNEQVNGNFIIIRDLTEQSKNAEMIKYMAYHDHLTGLYNRRAFIEHLDRKIRESKLNQEFAVLYLDLDRFKYLNDTLGHQAGDELLKKVGERLSTIVGNKGTVYRQGGDEFIIFLNDGTRENATKMGNNILTEFRKSFILFGQEYYSTPSIGISRYPIDGLDAETLVIRADSALHRVKERGKGHFQFYQEEMSLSLISTVTMETQLRKAIDRNEFTMHYQPQVDLHAQELVSFEALLRWTSQEFGQVSPGEFIPLAEESGLIFPIGEWVIDQVCMQLADWKNKGFSNVRAAVNLSSKQFQQPGIVKMIEKYLNKYHLSANALEIEITEGALQDTKETISILNDLKDLGIKISIDDFGTGYSSLSYLKQFPLDVLKIDQSFVKEMLYDKRDSAIIKTIVHLAHNLNLEVVAEGVETKEQAEFLRNVQCQKAQGYYFSKPLEAKQIEDRFLTAKPILF